MYILYSCTSTSGSKTSTISFPFYTFFLQVKQIHPHPFVGNCLNIQKAIFYNLFLISVYFSHFCVCFILLYRPYHRLLLLFTSFLFLFLSLLFPQAIFHPRGKNVAKYLHFLWAQPSHLKRRHEPLHLAIYLFFLVSHARGNNKTYD